MAAHSLFIWAPLRGPFSLSGNDLIHLVVILAVTRTFQWSYHVPDPNPPSRATLIRISRIRLY